MKRLLLSMFVIFVGLWLKSCVPPPVNTRGYTYEYKFSLQKPTIDTSLAYKDENMSIIFDIKEKGIAFDLANLSNDALKVNWDEAAIVWEGRAKKILHKGVKYIDAEKSQPPSIVPPTAILEEFVVPTENLKLSNYSGWSESSLFIIDDLGIKGHDEYFRAMQNFKFSLYLPIIKRGNQIDYSFEFKVDNILRTPKRGQAMMDSKKAAKK